MKTTPITIYHNPRCGMSRNALAMIRAADYEPTVVEYMQVGWTRALLDELVAKTGLKPRQLVRNELGIHPEDHALKNQVTGLLADNVSDETILAAMLENPWLVNRPIVVTPKGADLCRPPERVFAILDHSLTSFTKEEGQVIEL